MGRPALKKEEKKIRKAVFISPKTYKVLEEKATLYLDGNIGKYLSLILDKAILQEEFSMKKGDSNYKNDLYTSLRELNKIGSNLNQLTKLAHQGRLYESKIIEDLNKIDAEIKKLNLKIGELLAK